MDSFFVVQIVVVDVVEFMAQAFHLGEVSPSGIDINIAESGLVFRNQSADRRRQVDQANNAVIRDFRYYHLQMLFSARRLLQRPAAPVQCRHVVPG